MELQVLAQEISDATGIGKNDISLIIRKCMLAITKNDNIQTTIVIPNNNDTQSTYLIKKI